MDGCFQRRQFVCLFVCLPVCLFVCQHDNFRTIKHRMMKLSGYVRCTKISPEFERRGQRSKVKVTGNKKKRKSAAFCLGVVLWGTVLRQFYAGWKISACCLVWNCRCFVKHTFQWFDNVRWLSDTKGSRYARKAILPVPLHSLTFL